MYCWDVFRSNMCQDECALKKTKKEGKPFISTSSYIINSEKKRIPITVSTSLLKDNQGKVIGCVETFRDHSLVEELRKELSASYQIGDIISTSPAMKKIFKILPQVSESDSTVLLEGETGTGKELMAKAIHHHGPRKHASFVAVNCAALPETLLESELFGYRKGAFTDARRDRSGRIAQAQGGTLFLDEVGDLSKSLQVKLLRFLQEKTYEPLGSSQTLNADVRVITATHRNLEDMVQQGSFRKDLFFL